MPKLDANASYEKWKNRLTGDIQAVKDGIDRVTENPMAKAAAKEDKWFANLQKAKSQGRFKRGLMSVSLEDWKTKARDVGADRIPAGAAAAEGKMKVFYGKLLSYEASLQKQVNAMPDTTPEDSVNRATAWIRGMMQFDRTK